MSPPEARPKCRLQASHLSSSLPRLSPMLLLLLLAAPTTECPVRASSSPIALFFLFSLPQPHSPHLASPLTLLARLAQLLESLQHLVELSVTTSEQTVQLLSRRVRVSGRGHEIVKPRIVYSSQSTFFSPPITSSTRLSSPPPARDLPAYCLPDCLFSLRHSTASP